MPISDVNLKIDTTSSALMSANVGIRGRPQWHVSRRSTCHSSRNLEGGGDSREGQLELKDRAEVNRIWQSMLVDYGRIVR